MGYKDITPGDRIGRAIAARLIKSPEKGTPGIEVAFEFEEPSTGNMERLNWIGWLSAAAIEYTMETLVSVLETNGKEDVDANGVFTDPGFINTKKEVTLVIDLEEYADKKTGEIKASPKIKFVNNIGGSKFANLTPEIVKTELAATGFRAAFLAAKQASNQSAPPPSGIRPKEEALPF